MKETKTIKFYISYAKLDTIIRYLFLAIMVFQLGSTIAMNLRVNQWLDYDSSLAIRHCVEMWKQRTIFLRDFNYFSTLETDSAAFFAIPLYFLVGDMGVALSICHALLYFAFAFVLVDLFRTMGRGINSAFLTQILIFTPYTFRQLDWTNMMFFAAGQYEFRVLSMLLVLDAYENAQHEARAWKRNLVLAVSLVVNFWTALSCGNYLLLMVCLPCVIVFAAKGIKKDGFHFDIRELIVLVTVIAVNAAGWFVHNACVGQSFNNNKMLISAYSFTENLHNAVTGAFLIMGGLKYSDSISIFSKTGVIAVCKFLLMLAMFAFLLYRLVKKQGKRELTWIAILVFLVNFGALCVMNTQGGWPIFEYRYHILWIVMLFASLGEVCDIYRDMPYGRCGMVLLAVLLLLFNVDGTIGILRTPATTSTAEEILDVADEMGYESIYLLDQINEAHQIRALDMDKYCLDIYKSGDVYVADLGDFYISYGKVDDVQANLMIADAEAYEQLEEEYKAAYTYVRTLDNGLCVYRAEYSPWNF